MSNRVLSLFVCLSLVFCLSCGDEAGREVVSGSQPTQVSSVEQTEGVAIPELNVGHVGHDHQLALYVAALEGKLVEIRGGAYLSMVKKNEVYDLIDHGKTVARLHLIKVGGGSNMPAAMERGEIDIGLGGVAAVCFFIDKGNDFKIIFPLQTDGDMLVMKPDFSAADWTSFVQQVKSNDAVVKIGYKAPVAVAKLIFERALKAEKIPITYKPDEPGGKVELVNLQGEANMVPSLLNGAVDGFVINQPHASSAVHKGAGKIVCDLSTLPPEGKWEQHPCCCVAVPQLILSNHRNAVKSFLKVLYGATDIINDHPDMAVHDAAAWTKFPKEVEQDSVATVNYIHAPSARWVNGMKTWAEIMNEIGKFSGELKEKTPDEIVETVCDLSIILEILQERQQ